jgi:hypothetical protein
MIRSAFRFGDRLGASLSNSALCLHRPGLSTTALHLLVSAGRLDKQWQQREYN